MKRRITNIFAIVAVLGVLILTVGASHTYAAAYFNRCAIPALVGVQPKPNVMIVMDFARYMQVPAYFPLYAKECRSPSSPYTYSDRYCYYSQGFGGYSQSYVAYSTPLNSSHHYDPAMDYTGLFDHTKYYQYKDSEDPLPNNGVPDPDTDAQRPYFEAVDFDALIDLLFYSGKCGAGCYWSTTADEQTLCPTRECREAKAALKCLIENHYLEYRENIAGSEKGNSEGTTIKFTLTGTHQYNVGDLVRFHDLDGHRSMNLKLFKVVEGTPGGNYFVVSAQWQGIPDTKGYVEKKITGAAPDCISGDVMNWATSSRIDVALKALIGGKGQCPASECKKADGTACEEGTEGCECYCFLRAQGGQRVFLESGGLLGSYIHVRPGEALHKVYPNEAADATPGRFPYKAHPYFYRRGNYHHKDMYITISDYSSGILGLETFNCYDCAINPNFYCCQNPTDPNCSTQGADKACELNYGTWRWRKDPDCIAGEIFNNRCDGYVFADVWTFTIPTFTDPNTHPWDVEYTNEQGVTGYHEKNNGLRSDWSWNATNGYWEKQVHVEEERVNDVEEPQSDRFDPFIALFRRTPGSAQLYLVNSGEGARERTNSSASPYHRNKASTSSSATKRLRVVIPGQNMSATGYTDYGLTWTGTYDGRPVGGNPVPWSIVSYNDDREFLFKNNNPSAGTSPYHDQNSTAVPMAWVNTSNFVQTEWCAQATSPKYHDGKLGPGEYYVMASACYDCPGLSSARGNKCQVTTQPGGQMPWDYAQYALFSNVNMYRVRPGAQCAYNGAINNVAWLDGSHPPCKEPSVSPSRIGKLINARVRIKTPKSERSGVIQAIWDYMRFGLMYYRGDSTSYLGKILVGTDERTSMTDFINLLTAVECTTCDDPWPEQIGTSNNLTGTDKMPWPHYHISPAGEALAEVKKYYSQTSSTLNSGFIGKGTEKDPYYGVTAASSAATGKYVPVPCRKSFVLLVSGSTIDVNDPAIDLNPIKPAYELHTENLRPDLVTPDPSAGIKPLTADVYSLYVFSDSVKGRNVMKSIAMFGGFSDFADCPAGSTEGKGYPYPLRKGDYEPLTSSGASDSVVLHFSDCHDKYTGAACTGATPPGDCVCDQPPADTVLRKCDPTRSDWASDTEAQRCCKEWDANWDALGDGSDYGKFQPDAYFDSDSGRQLAALFRTAFQEMLERKSAAGAVATVSQQVTDQGGDIIVRAAFEGTDPSEGGRSLWFGHLEGYWPFLWDGAYKYDFDIPCNSTLLGYQMPGTIFGDCTDMRHNWDGAERLGQLSNDQVLQSSNRVIFTWVDKPWPRASNLTAGDGIVTQDEQVSLSEDNVAVSSAPLYNMLRATSSCSSSTSQVDKDKALVRWARGQENCYRSRTDSNTRKWRLGDVVYSTPVVAGEPSSGEVSANDGYDEDDGYKGFQDYVTAYQKRKLLTDPDTGESNIPAVINKWSVLKKVVYVGANDGMLHAFIVGVWDWENQRWALKRDAAGNDLDLPEGTPNRNKYAQFIGQELWAYMPSNHVRELKRMADVNYGRAGGSACPHCFSVDLSPKAWQVYINVPGEGGTSAKKWRTVLVGGERGGGDVYFAVDITDDLLPPKTMTAYNPDAPAVGAPGPRLLWEYSVLRNLVRAKSSTDSRWIKSLFANQYFSDPSSSPNIPLVSKLPVSWSVPYVGRLEIGGSSNLAAGDPSALSGSGGGQPSPGFNGEYVTGKRHIAFVGGGFRVFDWDAPLRKYLKGTSSDPGANYLDTLDIELLRLPWFLMLDIETGQNLMRYAWYSFLKDTKATLFPEVRRETCYIKNTSTGAITNEPCRSDTPPANCLKRNCTIGTTSTPCRCDTPIADCKYTIDADYKIVPYALSDPLALDTLDSSGSPGSDGYTDVVYVGDLVGRFWGIKLNTASKSLWVDMWNTRTTDESIKEWPWSDFRAAPQPTTTVAAASVDGNCYDASGTLCASCDASSGCIPRKLRVIFGTGKYDDRTSARDDKSDPARMTIYNLLDNMAWPSGGTTIGASLAPSNFSAVVNPKCTSGNFSTDNCVWMKNGGGDKCGTDCWDCVYDLTLGGTDAQPGERLVGRPLIDNGRLFFTTYLPQMDECEYRGSSYLYIFNYMCGPLTDMPLQDPGAYNTVWLPGNIGVRAELGAGLASAPVIDSSGNRVIVQMSDARILVIETVPTPTPPTGGTAGTGGEGGSAGSAGEAGSAGSAGNKPDDRVKIRGWRLGVQ
jgi:hypothetical protein